VLGRDVAVDGADASFFAPDGSLWLRVKHLDVLARPLPVGTGGDRLFARLEATLRAWGTWTNPDRLFLTDQSGGRQLWAFAGRSQSSRSIATSDDATLSRPEPSGRWLSNTPAADGRVRLRDLAQSRSIRPFVLRRRMPWTGAAAAFHPSGEWVAASAGQGFHLTLWPLRRAYPSVVDGYQTGVRPVAISADGQWLATSWADNRLRVWPLTDRGLGEPRSLVASAPPGGWRALSFDRDGRYLFAVGHSMGAAWVLPLDGSPPRRLECPVGDTGFNSAAIAPSGRRVAAASWFAAPDGTRRLCSWDLETTAVRHHDLPPIERSGAPATLLPTDLDGGVWQLTFADEDTLFTSGDGGLRRWDLNTGSQQLVARSAPGYALNASFGRDARIAITTERRLGRFDDCLEARLHDLHQGTSRPVTEFGACRTWRGVAQLSLSGDVLGVGGTDGSVRVGKLGHGQPHLLIGHEGVSNHVALSPDLPWVATSGEDSTLRLWPMPDLSKPPLHTLPHDELVAKLRSLTNLRVVPDTSATEGWRLEVGPFPGWKKAPEW
jgi:WD40 repeat protein